MNIVNQILKANQDRDPERLLMKYAAMRTDPFVFLRGTCHLFYDRLPKDHITKSIPLTWCCGDLHIQNFGSYKGDNRLVYFDINDFDEAALAPASWELVRLVSSIIIGGQSFDLSLKQVTQLSTQCLDAYADALFIGKARWVERETAQGMVKELLEQLQQRSRQDFLDSRTHTKNKHRRFVLDDKKLLPVSDEQRARIISFIERFANDQPHHEFYEVLDVARRVAGTGSLGVERYVILVEGKGSPDKNYLLDLKQAKPSTMAKHLKAIQPQWNNEAERVVTLKRRMQAVSMAFLSPEVIGKKSYILQALQPSEDRVPLAKYHHIDNLIGVVQVMGQCTAWAQLRSAGRQGSATADELVNFGAHKKWRSDLLELAVELSNQTQNDWETYCKAYDDGAFKQL